MRIEQYTNRRLDVKEFQKTAQLRESKSKMSKEGKRIPLKYKMEEGVADNTACIQIKCTDADGKEIKEDAPIFPAGGKDKQFLISVEAIMTIAQQYNWEGDNKGKLIFQHFERTIKDAPTQHAWAAILNAV